MQIDRMLDLGPVEIEDVRDGLLWRSGRSPGHDLSDLPEGIRATIEQHWNADVGGVTRVERWLAALPPSEAPTRRLVSKITIVERLIAVGKLAQARAALNAQPLDVQEKWNVRAAIYSDDETAVALLQAIGADPAVILASGEA